MREILFRGKPTESVMNEEDLQDCMFDIVDGFVYGNLITDEHEPTIVGKVVDSDWDYCSMEWWCPVEPETVGQYTGLTDKNGKRVFEGDIVKDNKNIGIIKYFESIGCFVVIVGNDIWNLNENDPNRQTKLQYTEIIGNIHDNKMEGIT